MLVRTQILFPRELYDRLKLEAALRETSMSRLVSRAVERLVVGRKKKMSGREAIEWMINHAYRGKVPRDLSINDEYLYGLK